MESNIGDLAVNKRFVTESELEERRQKRQEEWEKVRKPDDPEECPEEVYDPRSLYERLQEQKDKKQQEYEEQFKFKNMVRGLEEEETEFLDEVSRKQMLLEKERRDEERRELNEFRNARNLATTSTENKKREPEKKTPPKASDNKSKFSQSKLLAGAVRHRSNSESSGGKKLKLDQEHDKLKDGHSIVPGTRLHCPPASVCIGILPGLGAYSGSSDSESSSDGETTANNVGKIVSSVFRTGTYLEAP